MNEAGKAPIKRPPFEFEISDDFAETINKLVDAIESGDMVLASLYEQEVWTCHRELPEGSEEAEWILGYYYERGWKYGE